MKKLMLHNVKRTRYINEAKEARQKMNQLEAQLEEARVEVTKPKWEAADAKKEVEDARSEVVKMKEEEKGKLLVVDMKGYQDGFNRASAEYKRMARAMVNEALTARLPIAFTDSYKEGANAMAAVM